MMESSLILSTTFHKFPYRQISFFIAIFFLSFLLLFSSDAIASEESYIRRSNHQVWQLIQKKISPPPSSYRPADLRKSSHQVRFLEKSPIDYKERDLGTQESKGSFQGSVRPRSEDLNLLPRSQEFFEETLNLRFPEIHKAGFGNALKINPQGGGMTSRESTK